MDGGGGVGYCLGNVITIVILYHMTGLVKNGFKMRSVEVRSLSSDMFHCSLERFYQSSSVL